METHTISQQWEDKSSKQHFKMIDIGKKKESARRAIAKGTIHLGPKAFAAIINGTNPKGDVLSIAEVAGITAAKQTSSIIPLCHPITLENVSIKCDPDEHSFSVHVYCDVSATAKTGVEMEALSGVNGALLTIYDLSKAVDPSMTISNIQLQFKKGGKGGIFALSEISNPEAGFKLSGYTSSVITLSDRVSHKKCSDVSGQIIVNFLEKHESKIIDYSKIPDDQILLTEKIQSAVKKDSNLIFTTGGTGLGPKDNTIDTLKKISTREIPGFGELLRREGANKTIYSWLSRSSAFQLKQSLIIALPGSPKAVQEGLESLKQLLPHAIKIIRGGSH